jgi:hypothetical protein
MICYKSLLDLLRQLTLCKHHIGFSRALHFEMHIFKQTIAVANHKLLNKKIAIAKPAPSSAPALTGRQVVIRSFARDQGRKE